MKDKFECCWRCFEYDPDSHICVLLRRHVYNIYEQKDKECPKEIK